MSICNEYDHIWNEYDYIEWVKLGCPKNDKFKILNCINNQLSSLTEIKNLTNLTVLNCYKNKLTNLKSIKNLTNLTELYCHHN